MSQHPPGPWSVREKSASLSILDEKSRTVATIPWSIYERKPEVADANARLIAAAPEMAGLLRQLAEADERQPETVVIGSFAWKIYELANRARALLATVDGAAPA